MKQKNLTQIKKLMNEDCSAPSADILATTAWSIPTGLYEYTDNTYNYLTTNTLTTITDKLINIVPKETENNTPDELRINVRKSKIELNFKL